MTHSIRETAIELNCAVGIPAQRTYIVLGLERGGTSAVAGAARALGLELGPADMEGNNEDSRFQTHSISVLRDKIAKRNDEHDVWGWKYPSAVHTLPVLMRDLRAPRLIVVYRDAVATALSRQKWDGRFLRRRIDLATHEANALTNTNTTFALASGLNSLLVSHERARDNPHGLIADLAAFLDLGQPSEEFVEHLAGYLAPGSYKNFGDWFTARPGGGWEKAEPPAAEEQPPPPDPDATPSSQ